MSDDALARLRAICLALPEAEGREAWGDAPFRVRDKIFALAHGGGAAPNAACCKSRPGVQEMLLVADPARFFPCPTSATRTGSAPTSPPPPTGTNSSASSSRVTA